MATIQILAQLWHSWVIHVSPLQQLVKSICFSFTWLWTSTCLNFYLHSHCPVATPSAHNVALHEYECFHYDAYFWFNKRGRGQVLLIDQYLLPTGQGWSSLRNKDWGSLKNNPPFSNKLLSYNGNVISHKFKSNIRLSNQLFAFLLVDRNTTGSGLTCLRMVIHWSLSSSIYMILITKKIYLDLVKHSHVSRLVINKSCLPKGCRTPWTDTIGSK